MDMNRNGAISFCEIAEQFIQYGIELVPRVDYRVGFKKILSLEEDVGNLTNKITDVELENKVRTGFRRL
jgi:hypothetical protein